MSVVAGVHSDILARAFRGFLLSSMKGAGTMKKQFVFLALAVLFVWSACLVFDAEGQEIFIEEGFEDTSEGELPEGWRTAFEFPNAELADLPDFRVTTEIVKTGKKSLMVFHPEKSFYGAVPMPKQVQVVSVEFWYYVVEGGRGFTLCVSPAQDDQKIYMGATYIVFIDGNVTGWHNAPGQPMPEEKVPLVPYPLGEWQYLRVVVDFETQTFDLWSGDSPAAVRDRPPDADDYWNRNPGDQREPVSTWLAFWIFDTVTATYVDDLVVYEGATAIGMAVEPTDKCTNLWGEVKARY